MRIAQILLPDASYFDRKSFQIDQVALAERHELVPLAAAVMRTGGQSFGFRFLHKR